MSWIERLSVYFEEIISKCRSSDPPTHRQRLLHGCGKERDLLRRERPWSNNQNNRCYRAAQMTDQVLGQFSSLSNSQKSEFVDQFLQYLGPDQKWQLQQRLPEFLFRDFFTLLPDEVLEVGLLHCFFLVHCYFLVKWQQWTLNFCKFREMAAMHTQLMQIS